MKNWAWRDGQFSWGVVIVIVFAAASLQVIDYFWRITVLPFRAFALWAAGGEIVALIVLFALVWATRKNAGAGR